MKSSGAICAPFQKFKTVSMDLMEMRLKKQKNSMTQNHIHLRSQTFKEVESFMSKKNNTKKYVITNRWIV